MKAPRLGGKILELDRLSKQYGSLKILDGFSYRFARGDRVGMIGRNGTGKTTFLNVIAGMEQAGAGEIDRGETVVMGYYRQMGPVWKQEQRVIDAVKDPRARGDYQTDRTILWVDDRPDNNLYEKKAFESIGYIIKIALSTDEALSLLDKISYSAIISDMGRVEGPREGYKLLEALRRFDKITPFFIYAGSNAPEQKKEAAHRGAQGSTNNPQELFDLVSKYTNRSSSE